MKTNSPFSRNVYAISDRIWCNKHLRHTTTEKYDNNRVHITWDILYIRISIDQSHKSHWKWTGGRFIRLFDLVVIVWFREHIYVFRAEDSYNNATVYSQCTIWYVCKMMLLLTEPTFFIKICRGAAFCNMCGGWWVVWGLQKHCSMCYRKR